jgi:5'-nucleotidase
VVRWDTAQHHAAAVIEQLWPTIAGKPACLNVNFPDTSPELAGALTLTRQGVGMVQGIEVDARNDLRGGAYHWLHFRRGPRENPPDAESVHVGMGRITVTPLCFERTDADSFQALSAVLGDRGPG